MMMMMMSLIYSCRGPTWDTYASKPPSACEIILLWAQ